MKTIKNFIKTKKILSAIILIAIIGVSYWLYTKNTSTSGETLYSVAKARIGNVATTISGTGQVSASSQIEIKSKASGDITYLNTAANGTSITKGTLIAKIDTRDADIALQSAKIAYAKLIEPADDATILQAETSLNDAIQTNNKSYSDGFSQIVSTFIDMPTIINGLNDMFYSRTGYLQTENIRSIGQTALDLQSKAGISYDKAKNHYDTLLIKYKDFSNKNSTSSIESFVTDTYILAKEVSETTKNTQNAVDYVRNQRNDTAGNTAASSISTWANTINSDTSSLLSIQNTISNSRQNIIQQKVNLSKTQKGATDLEIASQKLSLQQAENTYQNYFIRAPFDGVLARLLVKPTDTLSSGTSVGTLVSANKIVTITLNEVDVSKVHVGEKAKITFDAITGLTMDGTVTTVDLVGTVSQGVVNYSVEIALDSQDDRIKSGMSASVSIITDSRENVLIVPNSAIKSAKSMNGNTNYVEVFATPLTVVRGTTGTASAIAPVKKNVEIGLVDDTYTEIISGINEGDQVVTKTVLGTAATTATKTTTSTTNKSSAAAATRSATGMFGGGGGGRIPGN